jgi:hypothetical protein
MNGNILQILVALPKFFARLMGTFLMTAIET